MAKIQISKATGAILDLLVSRAEADGGNDGWGWFEIDSEGFLFDPLNECRYSPSTIWAQGGKVIDREIDTIRKRSKAEEASLAHPNPNFKFKAEIFGDVDGYFCGFGPTSLIAAMRCYAISKLGDTAEVPDELV